MRNPFPPLKKLKQEVAIAYGEVKSSGYDLIVDPDFGSSSGYSRQRWLKIGGDTFLNPRDKLYFNNSGNYVCVAYHTRTKAILGFWNFTKQEGSKLSPSFLLHPYIWLYLISIAFFLWQLGSLISPSAALWVNLGLGAGLIITALTSFYEWKREQIAQEKITEFKQKNSGKEEKGNYKF